MLDFNGKTVRLQMTLPRATISIDYRNHSKLVYTISISPPLADRVTSTDLPLDLSSITFGPVGIHASCISTIQPPTEYEKSP